MFVADTKPCTKCGAQDRNKSGRCRPCKREHNRKYREENREELLEYARKYYEENREELLERKRKYYEENREKERESRRKYYEGNRDKCLEYHRKYREENSERVLEYNRKYYEENREKLLESHRKYRKENPGVCRRAWHNRRARKMNPQYPNDKLSRGLKRRLMKEQRGLCAYAHAPLADWCAKDIRKENHMDHVMPLSKGGRNIDSNMQITCPACNLRKGDGDPEEFARRVGLLI